MVGSDAFFNAPYWRALVTSLTAVMDSEVYKVLGAVFFSITSNSWGSFPQTSHNTKLEISLDGTYNSVGCAGNFSNCGELQFGLA